MSNTPVDDTVIANSFDEFAASLDDDNPFTEDNGASQVGDMVFPFGKHKGKHLSEVPKEYMQWCLSNMNRLDPKLREAMQVMVQG